MGKKAYDMIDFCVGFVIGKSNFAKEHDLFSCYQMFFVLKEYCNNNLERANEDEDEIIAFLFDVDLNKLWENFNLYGWDAIKK